MKTKIAVLLATYNGEKYLAEQIQSILKQSYSEFQLVIRDDGSSDKTLKVIDSFCKKDKRVICLNSQEDYVNPGNVGVVESFKQLLLHTNADYYLFCDQDDYWLPRKIQICLDNFPEIQGPVLVHTDLMESDSKLQITKSRLWGSVSDKFEKIMFTNSVQGCTIFMNESLKNLALKHWQSDKIYMHDFWIALVAANFGKIVYVPKATMLYRQHNNNVVGSGNGRLKKLIELKALIGRNIKTFDQFIFFYNQYHLDAQFYHSRTLERYVKALSGNSLLLLIYTLLTTGYIKPTLISKCSTTVAMFSKVMKNRGKK